jgi:hypothetical protein
MDNLTIIENKNELTGETFEHILIDRGNGEFTSMPKLVWDELQAKQSEGNLL